MTRMEKHWKRSADFLVEYLKKLRTKQGKRKVVYGAVAIGTYVRFYSLEHGAIALRTLGQNTRPLDFSEDKHEVHRILSYIANGCPNKFTGFGEEGLDNNIYLPWDTPIFRQVDGVNMANSSICR